MATKHLTVSCHCGIVTHTFPVPTSSLPLPSHLCSCDISRRISGSLLTSYINITHPTPLDPYPAKPDTSHCTAYKSSNILQRWFCTHCGTHMYLEYAGDGHFEAATGTLRVDGDGDGIVRFESCMWIGDTRDGGASVWVREIGGRVVQRWVGEAGGSEKLPVALGKSADEDKHEDTDAQDAKDEDVIEIEIEPVYAHCHCHGVQFWITPPDNNSKDAASPFPDLMIPHYLSSSESANHENTTWWLRTDGPKTKFLAGTCTCASCRRVSGFDITFWAFMPVSNIFLSPPLPSSDSSAAADSATRATPFPPWPQGSDFPTWGTMRTYASSPGVTRSFCSVCGANIFWAGDAEHTGRKGVLDVAVGLLDARSGARAEEVLRWWTERVSFVEEGVHRGLCVGLEGGLKEWGKGRSE